MGDEFPEELAEAQGVRVLAKMGWFPAVFGSALVIASLAMIGVWPRTTGNLAGIAIGIVLGSLLLWWELRRRRLRTVIVRGSGGYGIYRRRKLDVVTRGAFFTSEYSLHPLNTFKFLWIPFLMTIVMSYLAIAPNDQREMTVGERIAWLAVGLACGAVTVSIVYTRILCRHFFVPRRSGKTEIVALARSDVRRLTD